MNKLKLLQPVFLLLIVAFYSCEQKTKSADNVNHSVQKNESSNLTDDLSSSTFMQFTNYQKMLEIEQQLDESKKIQSLYWEKQLDENSSKYLEVEGYLNDDGELVKLIEHFSGGNGQPQGERIYFLEDNQPIYYEENQNVWVDDFSTQYIEKRTIFENHQAVATQIRTAESYFDRDEFLWEETPTEYQSLDQISRLLSGEGEFKTYFISVIKGQELFLLLGENKTEQLNRFTTAVRVDEMTPLIEDLLQHLEEYKFRPVNIQFKIVGGGINEPEFRVLTKFEWGD